MRVTMDGERIVPGIDDVWPRTDLLVCNPRFVRGVTGHAAIEDGLRELAWQLQPDTLVTRGAMETPEQRLPDKAPAGVLSPRKESRRGRMAQVRIMGEE